MVHALRDTHHTQNVVCMFYYPHTFLYTLKKVRNIELNGAKED